MDLKKIFEIVERIENSSLTKFEYSEDNTRIVLEKNAAQAVTVSENPVIKENIPKEVKTQGKVVKSPIVGTFYSKATPESEAFVSIGDRVKKGDILCIIEAMKLFNDVQSDFDGVIKEILVKDGDMVAYDQNFMIVE